MRTCLCMILLIVLSLTIPFTSAYAYGGGGGGGGGADGGGSDAVSVKSDTTNPPSGFTPTNQESTEIKTSSGTDPGDEEKVAELVDEVKAMGETTEEGDVEGDSKDSAEETESDEKAADDREDKSEDGTDKTEKTTIGVRRFLSQLTYGLPQGMQPAVDAVDKAAERAERVKHINDFFDKCGFTPPDLSDDKNLVKVDNLVREAERNIELQDEINKNIATATKYEKEREKLQRERDKQLQRTLDDYHAVEKYLLDKTVDAVLGPLGTTGKIGKALYSITTSNKPVEETKSQISGELENQLSDNLLSERQKSLLNYGKKALKTYGAFSIEESKKAKEMREALKERQQRRGQFESVPPSN